MAVVTPNSLYGTKNSRTKNDNMRRKKKNNSKGDPAAVPFPY